MKRQVRILAFEGLLSYTVGFVRRGLIRKIEKEFGKSVDVKLMPWTTDVYVTSGPFIMVGHSYGGHTALEFARVNAEAQLLTLDARKPWRNEDFTPLRLNRVHYNIFRKGWWLPGQEIRNAINTELPASVGHKDVPFTKEAEDRLMTMIAEAMLRQ